MESTSISIEDVVVGDRKRSLDEENLVSIMNSVNEIGLINPITVNVLKNGQYELVAGLHRLEAVKRLGKATIPAVRLTLNDSTQQLLEIDENLIRKELHYTERGNLLKQRKKIYESLQPNTKSDKVKKKNIMQYRDETNSVPFTKDVSKKTGFNTRTIQQDIQIAEQLPAGCTEKLKTLNIPKNDALVLCRKQKEVPLEKIIEKIESGKVKNVKNAIKLVKDESKQNELIKKSSQFIPLDAIQIWNGDFRTETDQIEDDSIDAIITDPPYPGEFLKLWTDLAEMAKRVLKPGRLLICYCGQYFLPEVIERLCQHLTYNWIMCLKHNSHTKIVHPRQVIANWKPILVFQKEDSNTDYKPPVYNDFVEGSPPEKSLHPWAQGVEEAKVLVSNFSLPNELILDPFLGSGSTLIAAYMAKRRAIGVDIERKNVDITLGRLAEISEDV